jgi:hypothetical protein
MVMYLTYIIVDVLLTCIVFIALKVLMV